jgi:hypothetical protein
MPATLPAGLKELTPVGYLGIDFGTCTTHIAYCYLDGNNVPQTVRLANKDTTPTCLLWREPGTTDEDVVAFGAEAMRRYSLLADRDRERHRFAASFKPDIAHGEGAARARLDSEAFLRQCYQSVRNGGAVRAVGRMEGMPVVVGVPAEVSREHRELTARIADKAGFGQATAVEEPLGALAFHLADHTLTPAEVRRGVVVVDFGGGTLDVALLDARHGVRAPWGDPTLGGRLFDDLFYQWLAEQNDDLPFPERDHLYVWQFSCRELKERFSAHWEQLAGGDEAFEYSLVLPGKRLATFIGTPAEFMARASSYRPSGATARYFARAGGPLAGLGRDGPVDLIGCIRAELARGFEGRKADVARVVLTGGSSSWPFMADLAAQAFGVDRRLVLRSAQPETTIGSGLALYRVLEHRNRQKQARLYEELPAYKKAFEEQVAARIDAFAAEATTAILTPLTAGIEEIYVDWHRNGGTLNRVRERVDEFTKGFRVADHLQGKDVRLARDLMQLLRESLRGWLKAHAVDRDADELVPEGAIEGPVLFQASGHAEDIAQGVSGVVAGTLATSVFAVVYTTVHGTHILVHPLTGVPTALLAAGASWLGYTAVDDKMREWIMTWDWGPVKLKALRAVFSEESLRKKIAASRDQTATTLTQLLRKGPEGTDAANGQAQWKTLDQLQASAVARFDEVVRQVIADLGVLEEVRKVGK